MLFPMRSRSETPPDPKSLHDVALRLLSLRDHSVDQLRRKLLRRGFEASLVEDEIALLRERGYLDDSRWAEQAARSRLRARYGARRVRFDLQRAGVEEETGSRALEKARSEEDEDARLGEALGRRMESMLRRHGASWVKSEEGRTKLAAHLLQRGYEPSAIIRSVDEAIRALADDEDDVHNRRSQLPEIELHHDDDHN